VIADVASASVVVHGAPPRKNRRHAHGGNGGPVRNSKEYLAWCEQLARAWEAASGPALATGRWHLHVTAIWPRCRDLGDVKVPFGDIDAPISAVLDGLQKCGAIDDDVRVCRLSSDKGFATTDDPPKVVIHLTLMKGDDDE
jgi:Holliday junction resolvase RusA-like endonuclease